MSIDYKAIADYYQQSGFADVITAYATMSAETVTTDKPSAKVTESMILSGLGMSSCSALIATLEANLPAPVIRVLQNEGIDVANSESKLQIAALLSGGLISQTTNDWLIAQSKQATPKWPGLKPGHISNALEWRAEGLI